MSVYLVTGANRGIGFGFVRQLSELPNTVVIATVRDLAKCAELWQWASTHTNVRIVRYAGTADEREAMALADEVATLVDGIDVVVANAAIGDTSWEALQCPVENWTNHYTTNVLAPILLLRALYPQLLRRVTRGVCFVSSAAASITKPVWFKMSAYGQSKAALNYTVRELDLELRGQGFSIVTVNPGPVLTDMLRGSIAAVRRYDPSHAEEVQASAASVDTSVKGMVQIVTNCAEYTGRFVDHTGKDMPW